MAMAIGSEGCIFRWWIHWNGVYGIHQTAASSFSQHRFPCRTVRPGNRSGVDGGRNHSFAYWSGAFIRSSTQLRHHFARHNSGHSQFGQHDFKLKLRGCGFWCLAWIMIHIVDSLTELSRKEFTVYRNYSSDGSVDGSGQKLERRFRLSVWSETDSWMQTRCTDLINAERSIDANSLLREFRLNTLN